MTQTHVRDGKKGSNESQRWLVTVIDKRVWNVVMLTLERLSNQGPCQMGY